MQPELLSSSAILAVIRKAVTRREDAALVYEKASRTDLAEKERKEVELLQAFIPPLLGEADIDRLLQEVISEQKLTVGDKKALDSKLVKSRADALFPSSS
ncbi:hypothetical protein EW026_g3570 [Hermanssonia centrifuga]|uniref:Altered inheritance of mitochondria protein 41 n=1 Tax=Hermanssonia centrifuga TaxID=98765 RepID=A0A4S4KJT1_9APHY|nr:hypothetical protein EW026_g3570 [Hermanssonia centrifuga]